MTDIEEVLNVLKDTHHLVSESSVDGLVNENLFISQGKIYKCLKKHMKPADFDDYIEESRKKLIERMENML